MPLKEDQSTEFFEYTNDFKFNTFFNDGSEEMVSLLNFNVVPTCGRSG